MTNTSVKPTHVRYGVIGFAVVMAMITYLHRVGISQAKTDISSDLGLSNTQIGFIFSAFTLAYALFEMPLGLWGDRAGPRKVLTSVVIGWSLLTALTGLVWNFLSLLICRFFFGAAQAGAFPNISKAFKLWLIPEERIWSQGILWMAARWGGSLAPILVFLIMQSLSWRWMFVVISFLGFAWAAAFAVWFRNHPGENPRVNEEELALLPKPGENIVNNEPAPWNAILRSSSLWFLCVQYFCQSYFYYFIMNWLPSFLREGLGLETRNSALFSAVPMFLGGIGCIFGSLLLRRLTSKYGPRFSRKVIPVTALSVSAICLFMVPQMHTGVMAIVIIGLATFSTDLSMATCWTTAIDLGGRFAGTVSGNMNMWGALGGFFSPMIIGILLDATNQNWNITFHISAAIYCIGVLMWLIIDPVTPLSFISNTRQKERK
jgi:ACS family glucarate transporter-like MFS transporter